MALRLIFMGTPDFAVPTLSRLIEGPHEIACVYTQPPRPAGRGKQPRLSPVHRFAERAGAPVATTPTLKGSDEQRAFAALKPDAAIVVAYGLILPRIILETPVHGCFNLHASLLPRWRGAAPIQRAIMAGDDETGATVMRMDEGLDTGPACLFEKTAITPEMTAGDLHDVLKQQGAELMVAALGLLERGALNCAPQPDQGATYADKIDKAEARIDWTRSASEIDRQIRGLSPYPGAWFEYHAGGNHHRIKALRSELAEGDGAPGAVLNEVLAIACGAGVVRLTELQRAGKSPQKAADFLRGLEISRGARLG